MAQPKEIRALLNPLRTARMIAIGSRQELKAGATKSTQREYYYVNYHEAVDALKYRIVKVAERVQDLYKQVEGQRKDWWCPRCFAEYDELSILDKVDPMRGFYCDRCGATLNQNEAAVKERGDHAKIRILNDQLRPFNALIAAIDSGEVNENAFEDAWANRRDVPQDDSLGAPVRTRYIEVAQQKNSGEARKVQAMVDEKALGIQIMAEKDQEVRDAMVKKEKSRLNALNNALPDWHSNSIKAENVGLKKEEGGLSPNPLLKKELDEQKPILGGEDKTMNDELDDVYQQILLERAEEERKKQEAEAEDEDDGEFDDDEDDEFEDAGPSTVGTPMGSQQPSVKQELTPTQRGVNGNSLKREFDADGDSISGTDTGANTPADSSFTTASDSKRIKLDNGGIPTSNAPAITHGGDSDEDDDFEDV